MATPKISFSDVLVFSPKHRKRSKTFYKLQELNKSVNWESLVIKLKPIERNNTSKGGRPSIPLITKIKMLFLQHSYAMSDECLEDNLLSNRDFEEFVGLGVSEGIPDFTTHWRFKEAVIKNNLLPIVWKEIEQQLQKKGGQLKRGEVTIVDASIIPSTMPPISHIERVELEKNPSSQKDVDATSTQKNGQHYFGYKVHLGVDAETKLIERMTFTTAKHHDITQVQHLATGKETKIIGDKAYVKKEFKNLSVLFGFNYAALNKATKSRPLSKKDKEENKMLSKIRCRVEHVFAHIKTKLKYTQATKKTFKRNEVSCYCTAMVYNIWRMSYLLKSFKLNLQTT